MVSRHSFKYAIQGLSHVVAKERNARFHLLMATLVLAFTLFIFFFYPDLSLTGEEFSAVLIAILLVFVAEILNTAVERMADLVAVHTKQKGLNETIGLVKDIMAGAVLVSAVGAVIIGIVIFLSRILIILSLA